MALAFAVITVLYGALAVATIVVTAGGDSRVPLADLIAVGFGHAGRAVYVLALASAARMLAGRLRAAALIAFVLVCVVAVFSAKVLLGPAIAALVAHRRPGHGHLRAARRAHPRRAAARTPAR